jgi:hypothetical protein
MSKKLRLQVLMEEAELQALRRAARRQGMTVASYVRSAIIEARQRAGGRSRVEKLAVLRRAVRHHDGPTSDIDQMLAEIERGYLGSDRS